MTITRSIASANQDRQAAGEAAERATRLTAHLAELKRRQARMAL